MSFNRSSLRWPGNKYSLLKNLFDYFPTNFNNYHEPFLGSATVFINTSFEGKAFISDSNADLINFYLQVQNNFDELIECVKTKHNNIEFYYKERIAKYKSPVERAAQLYFLNRTCYNGIYRVNSKGEFNVPYGHRNSLVVLDELNLAHLRGKLHDVQISACDFYNTLLFINDNDFVYLDPPYSGKGNDGFAMYNDKLFCWDDQIRLQKYCKILVDSKIRFVLNNLFNDEIYQLFANELGLKSVVTNRFQVVSSKIESRRIYQEYLFINA